MLDNLHCPQHQQRRKQKRLTTFYKATTNLFPVIPEYVKRSSGHTSPHDLAYVQLRAIYEQYKNNEMEFLTTRPYACDIYGRDHRPSTEPPTRQYSSWCF